MRIVARQARQGSVALEKTGALAQIDRLVPDVPCLVPITQRPILRSPVAVPAELVELRCGHPSRILNEPAWPVPPDQGMRLPHAGCPAHDTPHTARQAPPAGSPDRPRCVEARSNGTRSTSRFPRPDPRIGTTRPSPASGYWTDTPRDPE